MRTCILRVILVKWRPAYCVWQNSLGRESWVCSLKDKMITDKLALIHCPCSWLQEECNQLFQALAVWLLSHGGPQPGILSQVSPLPTKVLLSWNFIKPAANKLRPYSNLFSGMRESRMSNTYFHSNTHTLERCSHVSQAGLRQRTTDLEILTLLPTYQGLALQACTTKHM